MNLRGNGCRTTLRWGPNRQTKTTYSIELAATWSDSQAGNGRIKNHRYRNDQTISTKAGWFETYRIETIGE
jgi:hypothetical protein